MFNKQLKPPTQQTSLLEHTELFTDVGETLGLLRLVVDHVESHSLGQRSTLNLGTKAYLH